MTHLSMFGNAETEYIQLTAWFVGHTTCVCGQDLGANHSLIGRLKIPKESSKTAYKDNQIESTSRTF